MAAHEEARPGVAFWLTAVAGAAIVAFGIRGLLVEEARGATSAAQWFLGGAILVDLVVVPLGATAAWIVRRAVPPWTWPVVRAALLTTLVLIAFALPLVLDEGGVPSNPTVRPRNYAVGLAASLAVVWAAAGIGVLALARGRRRGRVAAPASPEAATKG